MNLSSPLTVPYNIQVNNPNPDPPSSMLGHRRYTSARLIQLRLHGKSHRGLNFVNKQFA